MIEYDNKAWIKLLLTIHGSILRTIAPRILILGMVSALFTLIHLYLIPLNNVAATPWTLVGVALGLLLVFRTNTAYERYWEGRRMWGTVVNASRSLAIATMAYIHPESPESPQIKRKIIRLTCLFSFLMKQRLRGERNLDEVAHLLEEPEKKILENSFHQTVSAATLLAKAFQQAQQKRVLELAELKIFDGYLVDLNNALGACERIKNTPLPLGYVLHIKRFLYIFCITVPLPLLSSFGWWTIIITALISYAFIGIEEIGVEIEDPFGYDPNDLPVDKICQTLENTLQDLYDKHVE